MFLAMEKTFSWLKSHFQSISQANMYFFSLGQNLLSVTKHILSETRTDGQTDVEVEIVI